MTTKPWSLQESFQSAWGKLLIDFREWFIPDTEDGEAWKTKPINQAITATKGRMVDEAEKMLEMWRQNQVDDKDGSSAYLPVMITAFEAGGSIPEISSLRSMPTATEVVIGTDAHGRVKKMRTVAMGIHAQVAIFTPNPHSAISIATQLIAYLGSDQKRRVPLRFDLGDGIIDHWDMTIFDNNLYPSRIPSEAENISIVTIDVNLAGLVPQLIRDPNGNLQDVPIVVEANLKDLPVVDAKVYPKIEAFTDGSISIIPAVIGTQFQAAGLYKFPIGTWTGAASFINANAVGQPVVSIQALFVDGTQSTVTVANNDLADVPYYLSADTSSWAAGSYEGRLTFTDNSDPAKTAVSHPFLIEVFAS